MSVILDFAILAIIAITIYFAYKNGFVKTAVSAVSFILAIVVTAMFASPTAEFLKQTAIAETVETATENAISDILIDTSLGVTGLLDGKSEEFNKLVALTGQDMSDIASWYENKQYTDTNGEIVLAARIAEPITDAIASVLAVILLFIGTQIAIIFIARALDIVAKLPILRTANKGLGIALGAVLAFLRVTLFCFAMNVLIKNSAFLESEFLMNLEPESTVLFKFFSEINIFSFFI